MPTIAQMKVRQGNLADPCYSPVSLVMSDSNSAHILVIHPPQAGDGTTTLFTFHS